MSDFNRPIHNLYPHYTNERFSTAQTVWLAKGKKLSKDFYVKGANYHYSDRIWQWDWNKANKAREAIDTNLDRNSPAYIQAFLRHFFDNPQLELVHVLAGYNVSNGNPYQVYGYIETKVAQK